MLQHSPQRWPSTRCGFRLAKVKVRCVGHLTHTIWYIVGGRDEGLPEWGKLTRAEGAPRTRAELKPERGNALGTNLNPRELSPIQ